ncbi:MAG: dienelactone hydrolase family protein [Acidobacteriota bacterium]|nr:dienelactone hydrolase family protein [Acidobacteriota bacterium]
MRKELLSVVGGLISNAASGAEKGMLENRSVTIDSSGYNYQIYVPAQLQNEENAPIIVFLHGIGQRGTGGFVPTTGAGGLLVHHYFGQVGAIVLLPQCRAGSYWSDPIMDEMMMKSLAQTVEEFSADKSRVYLTGVSMGGYGVWHFAAAYPQKFAALVSICGGSSIVNGERFAPVAEKIGKTPAWLFHGADDRIVPVTESRKLVEALKANGGNVKYNEYAGVGHNVWMNALGEKDLLPWLLAQRL